MNQRILISNIACGLLTAAFSLAAPLFIAPASAQVQRTVLLEEGTNWACGPCAQLNPLVEEFPASHKGNILQLSYHPTQTLDLFDIAGAKRETLQSNSTVIHLSVEGLTNGVYHYNLRGTNERGMITVIH